MKRERTVARVKTSFLGKSVSFRHFYTPLEKFLKSLTSNPRVRYHMGGSTQRQILVTLQRTKYRLLRRKWGFAAGAE